MGPSSFRNHECDSGTHDWLLDDVHHVVYIIPQLPRWCTALGTPCSARCTQPARTGVMNEHVRAVDGADPWAAARTELPGQARGPVGPRAVVSARTAVVAGIAGHHRPTSRG